MLLEQTCVQIKEQQAHQHVLLQENYVSVVLQVQLVSFKLEFKQMVFLTTASKVHKPQYKNSPTTIHQIGSQQHLQTVSQLFPHSLLLTL